MFSKEESKKLKAEFWTAFGKSFPRKWLLYDTKIKDFSLKFYADPKKAQVLFDVEMADLELREAYYNKLWSLEEILKESWGEVNKSFEYTLENGKEVSRFWVELQDVSIYRKESWREIFEFFYEKMSAAETLFYEFEDFIKDV